MTAVYRCDGPDCGRILEKGVERIELRVERPPAPPEPLEDGELPVLDFALAFDFDASAHFCSLGCLAGWAMMEHLNKGDTAP